MDVHDLFGTVVCAYGHSSGLALDALEWHKMDMPLGVPHGPLEGFAPQPEKYKWLAYKDA